MRPTSGWKRSRRSRPLPMMRARSTRSWPAAVTAPTQPDSGPRCEAASTIWHAHTACSRWRSEHSGAPRCIGPAGPSGFAVRAVSTRCGTAFGISVRLRDGVRHQRQSDVARRIQVADGGPRHRIRDKDPDLRGSFAHDIATERLATFVAAQNLVQKIAVVLTAAIELALQVPADTAHLILGQPRLSHRGDLLEHPLHEALDFRRIAGPLDADAILGSRIPAGLGVGGNRVGRTELLANRLAQARLQQHRRRLQRELA